MQQSHWLVSFWKMLLTYGGVVRIMGSLNTGGITDYLISSVGACRTEVNGIAEHKMRAQASFDTWAWVYSRS